MNVCKHPVGPLVAALLLLCAPAIVRAQDEPQGPPGSQVTRMKTLNQIEPRSVISSIPFTITNSGSYYLTQNLTGDVTTTNGIIIAVGDVTLDLGGFVISGTTNGSYGISLAGSSYRNITIRNGVVRGWGQAGLYLQDGVSCRLSDITAVSNGTSLAFAAVYVGQDWDVADCSASMNRNGGFYIGEDSHARNCRARGNKSHGFILGNGSRLENCSASANADNGIQGGMMTMILNCTANYNTNSGIHVGLYASASGNISAWNGGAGLVAGTGSRVERNVVSQNGAGGIVAEGYSRVTENQVVLNTGAGIMGKTGSRVDNNHVFGGTVGVQSDSSAYGSLFVANSVGGCNTNYVSTPSANFGQIVTTNFLTPTTNFFLANPWVNFDL